MAHRGNAGFKFATPWVPSVTITLALDWPLRNPRPATVRSRWGAWSLDKTEREVLTVGAGAAEMYAEIRFQGSGPDLLEMLDAGASGAMLTYYPDLDVTGTNYPCELVEPEGDRVEILRDQARSMHGEYEVTVRLRRTDGGTFDALL
jgi:hypothetical protein